MCSSIPRVRTPRVRSGRLVRRAASPLTARHSVCQSTRRCRASAETVVSSSASASVAQATARDVNTARGAISWCVSDQVSIGQSGSSQRQTRLSQTIRTGIPKHGASAAVMRRRPCPVASTPQPGHPGDVGVGLDRNHQVAMPATHVNHVHPVGVEHRIGARTPARGRCTYSRPCRGLHSVGGLVAPDLEDPDPTPRYATPSGSTTLKSEEPYCRNRRQEGPAWPGEERRPPLTVRQPHSALLSVFRSNLQCLHFSASGFISSLQYGQMLPCAGRSGVSQEPQCFCIVVSHRCPGGSLTSGGVWVSSLARRKPRREPGPSSEPGAAK
jgi:hypothetical protein